MEWPSERSTYHKTMAHKVSAYLTRGFGKAEYERSLISGRTTDAFGYDEKIKTWYLCEIKVDGRDLYKAVVQIDDTVKRFKNSPLHKKYVGVIVPVIAIPKRVYDDSVKYSAEKWESYCSLCKTNNIALWVIEQSTVRQIQGPKPKTTTRARVTAKPKTTARARATAKPKTTTKTKTLRKTRRK